MALVGLILQRNWQRSGVATQATLHEFRASQKVTEGGETVMVMQVARHKTSRQEPAHVVMTMDDYKFTQKYVNRVRPQQDPSGLREELRISAAWPQASSQCCSINAEVGAPLWHQCGDAYEFEEGGGNSCNRTEARGNNSRSKEHEPHSSNGSQVLPGCDWEEGGCQSPRAAEETGGKEK